MLISDQQVMINPLLHRSLKSLLWICILGAATGLVVQILGSDVGALIVYISCALGTVPAFYFASLVAFKNPGANGKRSDNPPADRSQPPRGDRE